METAIQAFINELHTVLSDKLLAVYLYGSMTLDDFRPGWSDIDILCLTDGTVTAEEAARLVDLRQTLAEREDNSYYRCFEGAVVSLDEFKVGTYTRVVYWGTGKQKVTDQYGFDAFSLFELMRYGRLLRGKDIRGELALPSYEELKRNVLRHYETIRKYAVQTGESIYSCGWLLDIARCIYTLRHYDILGKTQAGEWALANGLCPIADEMRRTLALRQDPIGQMAKTGTKEWLRSLGPAVQRFADILEEELRRDNYPF
ncbi:MAG: nucleotidyltransferase domain-containing protein [Clostridia bacterium]|nr:nucleotidyltransferase domain-containing protein [Clostridia bacterium]